MTVSMPTTRLSRVMTDCGGKPTTCSRMSTLTRTLSRTGTSRWMPGSSVPAVAAEPLDDVDARLRHDPHGARDRVEHQGEHQQGDDGADHGSSSVRPAGRLKLGRVDVQGRALDRRDDDACAPAGTSGPPDQGRARHSSPSTPDLPAVGGDGLDHRRGPAGQPLPAGRRAAGTSRCRRTTGRTRPSSSSAGEPRQRAPAPASASVSERRRRRRRARRRPSISSTRSRVSSSPAPDRHGEHQPQDRGHVTVSS